MDEIIEQAAEISFELERWKVNPFSCLYHNPNRYSIVEFARWAQRYCNYREYRLMLRMCALLGFLPFPAVLVNRNASRYPWRDRRIRIVKTGFYIVREDELSPRLKEHYRSFQEILEKLQQQGKNHKKANSTASQNGL